MNAKVSEPAVRVGDKYKCVTSKSFAYTLGKVYTVSKDNAGVLVLTGNDGLTDPLSGLMSKFMQVSTVKFGLGDK